MIQRFPFTLNISLRAPFLQSGLAQASIGHDATPLVDQKGRIIISGDQVEGYVKAVMQEAGADCSWFGKVGAQIADDLPDSPQRALLKIFDLVQNSAPERWHNITRISVDEDTGAEDPGALQVIAQSHESGDEAKFSGNGWILAATQDEAQKLLGWIKVALDITPSLGAIKSAGFGRIVDFEVSETLAACPLAPASPRGPEAEAWGLELTFEQPFLVDSEQRSSNVYNSSEIIPGHIIKGAIADMIALGGGINDFSELLSAITVRHAFPGNKRPKMLPLSLAMSDEGLVDVLSDNFKNVPRFQMDWKLADWEHVSGYYTPGLISRYVRTRTAIGKNGLPEEGKLFSQRMISTYDGHAPRVWTSALILPEGTDASMKSTLGALSHHLAEQGILRIGKTAAPVQIDLKPWEAPGTPDKTSYRIILQTSAWMTPTETILANDISGDAFPLYQAYFEKNGCELVDFIALQQWWGGARAVGNYSAAGSEGYYPWLLTRAGSVFIVRGLGKDKLAEWLRIGLPPAENMTWEQCALLRENGFGEIRVEAHHGA